MSMKELQAAYAEAWKKLGYAKPKWELELKPGFNGGHHIEFADGKYRWIASERGVYLDVIEHEKLADMLDVLVLDFTYYLAHREAFSPKRTGADEERHAFCFGRQLELLEVYDPRLAKKRRDQLKRDKVYP